MHMELYLAQKLTVARIGDLRAASARAVLLGTARPRRRGIRAAFGEALIRAGRGMLRDQTTGCPARRRDASAGR